MDIEADLSGEPTLAPTLSEIIPLILNGLVDGRVWQLSTPDDLPRDSGGILPFIIWHRVGGQDGAFYDQTAPDHAHARVQIQCCARNAIVAERLERQCMQAMLASIYTVGVYGSPVGAYDAARKLHAPWRQFSIWFRQS